MARKRMKLGEMLLEAGLIDEFQLNSALSHQRNCSGGRLGASLVRLNYISEESLLNFLSEQLSLPRIDLAGRRLSTDILAYIPAEKAWEFHAVPVERKEMHGTLFLLVAMADPTNLEAIDAIQFMTGCRVRPALAFDSAIKEALVNHYGPLVKEKEETAGHPSASPDDPAADIPCPVPAGLPAVSSFRGVDSAEEKLQHLLKILVDKGILTLREYDRLK